VAQASPSRTHPLAALALVGASLLVLGLVLELAFVPLLPLLPRKLHVYLDPALRPLAASSKRAALPHDYVALVGDSYAQGRGDWLLESDSDANGPYSSAHVLHAQTGRDVISWGRGGAGVLTGWVAFPLISWRALQPSWRTRLAPPALLIAFFYEGNDLEDTVLELGGLRVLADPAFPEDATQEQLIAGIGAQDHDTLLREARAREPAQLESLVAERFVPFFQGQVGDPEPRWRPALYFPRFLAALVKGEVLRLLGRAPEWEWEGKGHFGRNRVRLEGQVVQVPGSLQGPGMQLSDEETDLTLQTADRALGLLAAAFPTSALCVLRVPSPAGLYAFADQRVSVQGLRGAADFPADAIRARSGELGARVNEIALRHGALYVDASPALRDAAASSLIHGPRDWRHLNRRGQTVLGELAAQCLAAPAPAHRSADAGSR